MGGHKGVAILLLNTRTISNLNFEDDDGETVLLRAAKNGHTAIVQELLQSNDIDVDKPDNSGKTPLIYTLENGHIHTFRLLAIKGADIGVIRQFFTDLQGGLFTGGRVYTINGKRFYAPKR
jgi:ankyrin repeat protein